MYKVIRFFKSRKPQALKKKILVLYKARQENATSDDDIKKEIALNLRLAKFYEKHVFDKYFPRADWLAQECYRAAASLGDAHAQYVLSQRLFKQGRFWQQCGRGPYGANIHKQYADDCYREAFQYQKEAEDQGHPLAKRMHGMALIHGWGVEPDEEKGFRLVVDSIELEGSWEKATKIFTELGLNKSEFFKSIMQSRKK